MKTDNICRNVAGLMKDLVQYHSSPSKSNALCSKNFLKGLLLVMLIGVLTSCTGEIDPTTISGGVEIQIDTSNVAFAYEESCQACHGDSIGNNAVVGGALTSLECTACTNGAITLADVISETMPRGQLDSSKTCVGKCASDFASYILDNFDGYGDVALKTGRQLYDQNCMGCHGDGIETAGLAGSRLIPTLCSTCGSKESFLLKVENTMPASNPGACKNECASKIYDYIFENFEGYQSDVTSVAQANNLSSPKNFNANGNTLSWDALATAPEYWIVDGWNDEDAEWNSVARVASDAISHTMATSTSSKYRLYSVTDKIASVPAIYASPSLLINSNARDIWGTADSMHYSYQPAEGNIAAKAKVELFEVTGARFAKSGIMLRENLTAGSRHVAIVFMGDDGVRGLRRETAGGNTTIVGNQASSTQAPVELRLVREGTNVTLFVRTDGGDFENVGGAVNVGFTGGFIGLAVGQNNGTNGIVTRISNFTVNNAVVTSASRLDLDGTAVVTVSAGVTSDDSKVAIRPYVDKLEITYLNRFEYRNSLNNLFDSIDLSFDNLTGGDKSSGYEVGFVIDPLGATEFTNAAEAFSTSVTEDLDLQCASMGAKDCALNHIRNLIPKMIRRPVSEAYMEMLSKLYDDVSSKLNSSAALQTMYEAVANSASFLYRVETAGMGMDAGTMVPVTGYEMASRLSFTLWASGPDQVLLDAAESGELTTPAQIRQQAERMVDDPKAMQGFKSFYRQWFDLDRLLSDERESAELNLNKGLAEAMLLASDAFVKKVVFDDNGTVNDFFTAPFVGNNAQISAITGINSSSEVSEVVSSNGSANNSRSGILGQPAVLSRHAVINRTSIVERGKFVNVDVLCKTFPTPPDDIPDLDEVDTEGKSARVVIDELTATPTCASCHQFINPVGGVFEAFDNLGRHRTIDVGNSNLPINTQSDILSRDTGLLEASVDGLAEFNTYLASLDSVKECFANQYVSFAIRHIPDEQERLSVKWLVDTMKAQQWNIKQLLVETTQTPVFLYRQQ